MPHKNPTLCEFALSRLKNSPHPVALAGNPLCLISFLASRHSNRNEKLQLLSATAQLTAVLPTTLQEIKKFSN